MLRDHAKYIYENAIKENLPNSAVKKALGSMPPYSGRLVLVAIGKASYQMAKTAYECLGEKIDSGIVITKYGHVMGNLGKIQLCEASHPVLDEGTLEATSKALKLTEGLSQNDLVLFLVSGGGSALFESLYISLDKMQALTHTLLKCGASIEEINTVRKHLSRVKGGNFAMHCMPAGVYSIILSDVLGNRLDTIASGPTCVDKTTVEDAKNVINKYKIPFDVDEFRETPKEISNATYEISGSVSELCKSAEKYAVVLGYETVILRDDECGEARELGAELGALAKKYQNTTTPKAFIVGGETIVNVKGDGKGGRNQEIALSGAIQIKGLNNVAIFSVGSDGTDGPTDSAGGYVNGNTYDLIAKNGKGAEMYLNNNDAYNALSLANGLIFTGPTGTNVNDISVLLINPKL